MRLKLSHKLGMIMVTTVILSALISAVIISFNTRSAFMKLVRENDIQTARSIARSLEAYYDQFGTWEGIEELLENPFRIMQDHGGMNQMRNMGPMGSRFQRGPEGRSLFRVLLTDEQGRVIAHTFEEVPTDQLGRHVIEEGIALYNDGEKIGFVFVGSMVETAFGPFQRAFLTSVYRSILFASLIVGLLLPIIAVFLMRRHITYPLKELTEATHRIARGDYSVSMQNRRTDEIGELAQNFQQMTGELAAADEWKKKLIADSAHELRTPVSVLQGNLEMMLEGIYPINRERIQGLHSEILLLKRLVEELQDLAHAESGFASYDLKTVDVKALLNTTIENFRTRAAEKSIDLQLTLPEYTVEMDADQDRLKQVIINVMQNAVHYSPEGGVIDVVLYKNSDELIVCAVEDNGVGVKKEEREKVFERFYRVQHDRNRKTGGSGLGLSIAREIIRGHGGNMYFEDPKINNGARVVIKLPISNK